ncbi:MAG: alpha/beta hydrolase [Candidatus Tectomicrobia bacterium]|nr:alpha/beta hydrolase [Candidatus Tectomicrobia bacterium]
MATVDCVHSIEGNGPPVFMIHGIGARRAIWNDLTQRLAENFTCISYDLRGHGDSPVSTTPFSLDDLVDDLEALREKLGIDKAHVIGISLGGMIGPAYTRAHPDRVNSLGLLSTAAGRTAEDRAKLMGVIAAMEEQGIEPVLDTLVQRWYTDDFIAARPDAIQARIRDVLDTPPDVFMNVFHIYAETEMAPWLDQITVPALVLTGELDGGCNPRLNRLIADKLPNSELVILDNLKHSILIEGPERVAAAVQDFLIRQIGD